MRSTRKKPFNTEALVLGGWALFFVFILVSGRLPLYINPKFAVLPVVGALMLAAMTYVRVRAGSGSSAHRDWSLAPWFLMPVVIALVVPPVGLGAFVAGNRQSSLMGSSRGNSSITLDLSSRSGYKQATILELTEAGTIKGGKVSVVGQLLAGPDGATDECLIAHYQMVCCVADLRPVVIVLKYPSGYVPKINQWVRVNGTAKREARGVVLTADSIEPISAPNPPYLY